jgi:hypothetical protein
VVDTDPGKRGWNGIAVHVWGHKEHGQDKFLYMAMGARRRDVCRTAIRWEAKAPATYRCLTRRGQRRVDIVPFLCCLPGRAAWRPHAPGCKRSPETRPPPQRRAVKTPAGWATAGCGTRNLSQSSLAEKGGGVRGAGHVSSSSTGWREAVWRKGDGNLFRYLSM